MRGLTYRPICLWEKLAYLYGQWALLPHEIATRFASRHRASASAADCGDNHGRDGKQHADVDAMCGGILRGSRRT